MRNNLLVLLGCMLAAFHCQAGTDDTLNYVPLNQIKVAGHLGKMVDQCIINRVEEQSATELIEPFTHKDETRFWQTEFWGKWLLSAIDAYQYKPSEQQRKNIDAAVANLVATQMPDGYIGNYSDAAQLQQWDIWGRKYVMLGLLRYYDLTLNKDALKAARDLADHLMREVGSGKANIVETGNYRGMPSSSVLEPIVLLYTKTHDQRYLDFANYIVKQWETPLGPQLISKALEGVPVASRFPFPKEWWTWDNGGKAYEMMSCYDGLLALYRVTHDPKHLQAVELAVQNIIKDEINIAGSGSSFECWYHGAAHQTLPTYHTMETCVTMTWMKLCMNLLQLTGKSTYADQIEQTLYNALLASMTPDGSSFAKYSPLEGYRSLGEGQCGMSINCCIANGPRAIMMVPKFALMSSSKSIYVNLFAPLKATVVIGKNNSVAIDQSTTYPLSGTTTIKVNPKKASHFSINVRIPSWSKVTTLMVNDEPIGDVKAGEYKSITRLWKAGDEINVTFDMRGRLFENNFHATIMRGPVVLARDSRFDDGDVDEAGIVVSKDGYVDLIETPSKTEGIWMSFTTKMIKGTNLEQNGGEEVISLCDYASAGDEWKQSSRYRVWLPAPINVMKNPFGE